jgi:hypothetical protein
VPRSRADGCSDGAKFTPLNPQRFSTSDCIKIFHNDRALLLATGRRSV